MRNWYNAAVIILRGIFLRKKCLKVGAYTYIGRGFKVYQYGPEEKVTIGKFCSIADNVKIFAGGEHRHKNRVTTYPLRMRINGDFDYPDCESNGPVEIGNDVWIGSHVIILSGVSIGNGAVIGAGAVITSDVADYSISAGNPARLIGYRFSSETIEKLLQIKWWNWEIKKIKQHCADFYAAPETFVKKHIS
jgi:acetyltransferase-like isoleucine patch superfamily enzyme